MKRTQASPLWIGFTLFCLFSTSFLQAQQRHALIFSISNYPPEGGWTPIAGQRDLYYLQQSLSRQGFVPGQISVVKDSMATKAGISNALEALVKRVKAGDIVYVHFSCHGQQIEDDNNDEADGLDESIVSYNAVYSTNPALYARNQQNYFRDDQLGEYVTRLRRKLGAKGDLVVFINACHSGTGTRGNERVRGGKPAMVSAGFSSKSGKGASDSRLMREEEKETGDLSPYVILSAAQADELDKEIEDEQGQRVGSLSYATCKALEQLDKQTTYRSLFVRIQLIMLEKSLHQHPVLEGNGADRLLFGGQFREQKPYAEIEKRVNTREYWLNKGKLAGLDLGAKVGLYSAGIPQTEGHTPLATGTVTEATLYKSKIKLSSDPRLASIVAGWVFVTEPVFKLDPVRIRVETQTGKTPTNGFTAAEAEVWQKKFESLHCMATEEADLVLVKGKTLDTLKVAANGQVFREVTRSDEDFQQAVQDFRCYTFIRNLEVRDPGISAEVKLWPVLNGQVDTANTLQWMRNGIYAFYEWDSVVLQVTNKSRQALYLNLIDLQPNGVFSVLLPNRVMKVSPEDLRIKAGETRILTGFPIVIHPPYGTEMFKFFLSRTILDLEPMVQSRGEATTGNGFAFLDTLLKNTYKNQSRGSSVSAGAMAEGMATGLVFIIQPGNRSR